MKRVCQLLAAAMGVCLGLGAFHAPTPASAATANPAPAVQPGLQSWTGGTGSFVLEATARIVVDSSHADDLSADARTFAADLRDVTGAHIPVVRAAKAGRGDIFLTEGATGTAATGYKLSIDTTATVSGSDATGTFYGEQTLEQMLKLSPTRSTLPQGSASDWPRETLRSEQIDVARHYQSVADLEQQIRIAAWLKLDSLHLHLSDNEAFRMQSTTFPGLANVQSYSHADIAAIVDYAHKYHVDLIPEIDLPGHGQVFTHYDTDLAFACPTLGLHGTAAYAGGGSTMDVTNPATLDFATKLLDEFVPLFKYSRYFHMGGDETPSSHDLNGCPEVASYVKAQNYKVATDVFTTFQNKLADVVTGLGKTPIIWNWNGDADILAKPAIVIDAWIGGPGGFINQGHQVIDTQSSNLYVVPDSLPGNGSTWIVNDGYYYTWTPPTQAGYLGLEVTNWGDRANPSFPDSFYRSFSTRPAQVFAAVGWGGPRAKDFLAFESQVDAIGAPPGMPETIPPGATALTGTAYAEPSSPATPAANAFDGNGLTSVDVASGNAGAPAYVGLDLGADHAAPVSAVRYLPAMSSMTAGNSSHELAAQKTMVGGQFQGCTTGPTTGCNTLATVKYRPTADWQVLPVAGTTHYRWLRYVAAPGQPAQTGEIQFLTAPASPLAVSVSAPPQLGFTGRDQVTATITNTGTSTIHGLRAGLSGTSVDDSTPLTVSPTQGNPTSIAPGATVTATWRVSAPVNAAPGDYRLVATASVPVGSSTGWAQGSGSAVVQLTHPAVVATIPVSNVPDEPGAPISTTMTLDSSWPTRLTVHWDMPNPDYSPVATFSPGSATIPAHGRITVHLTLAQPRGGLAQIPLTITDPVGRTSQRWDVGAPIVSTLAQAFNSVGITSDANRSPSNVGGGLDGDGSTLSAETLAAAGVTPGGTVNSGGYSFTWPDVPVDTADNVSAGSQVIGVGRAASSLGLLTLAGGGAQNNAGGTVYYTDGSAAPFTVTVPDWHVAPAAGGPQPALTLPYVNYAGVQWNKTAYLYVNSVPLDPAKTVSRIVLPTAGGLHVFAIATAQGTSPGAASAS
ncbi:family 20 glycosylhydrolase [Streptomyces sp. NPDC020917]|uniref:family 20 glycosylhydrolase n=1 Tax=Streptomyces sp. NPDC020917 TaxID=3365102 RepID=UPI0037B49A97